MNEELSVLENEQATEVTPEAVAQRICPQCGKELPEGKNFCPACGHAYEEPAAANICANCGAEIPNDDAFCAVCGAKRGAPAAQSPATPAKKRNLLPILIGIGVAVIAAVVIFLNMGPSNIPVEDISVDQSKVEITEEESVNISCEVYPKNATNKNVTWSSSDEEIAIVDEYGRITAVSAGECEITAKVGREEEEIKVIVKKKLPDLKAIYDEYCNSTWADLGEDYSYLSVDTNPFNKDDGDYTYMFTVNDIIEDINKALGLPDSLYQDMQQTAWSMGKQEEVFDAIGLRVTWTYHPDKGLEVTYKLILD